MMCNKTIEFMFAGENMFWARLRPILARAFIYAQEINCSTIVMTLEGIEEMKTEKKKKRQQNSVRNISLTNAVRKRQQTL